jgi:polysaccharide biosynthesis protein PslG
VAVHDVGYNVHQSLDTGVEVSAACGGSIVRIDLNWFQAEPKEGMFDWALFDNLINGARAKNQRVLAVLSYTPGWASSANKDGKTNDNDVPKPGYYEKFVKAAVERYRDRVEHFEIWNEPNLEQFFEGTPQQYVDLILKPGADAVHAACPSCKTLAPDLATISDKYAEWMKVALEQAKDKIDIVSGHVYSGFPKIPDDTNPNFFAKLEKHRILKLPDGTVVYEDPLSLRESMIKYGAASKPFWMTETGETAKYGDTAAMEKQAVFYRKVLEAMLTRPWWQNTIFYESFDEPTMSYDWGVSIRDPAGGYKLKPACDVVKKAVAEQPLYGGKGSDCSDGLDNEGDGKIDYPADDDCSSATTASEGQPPAIDAGTDTSEEEDASIPNAEPTESSGCGCSTSARSNPSPLLLFAIVLSRRFWLFVLTLLGCTKTSPQETPKIAADPVDAAKAPPPAPPPPVVSTACSNNYDCEFDDPCMKSKCVHVPPADAGGQVKIKCEESAPKPGDCMCIKSECTLVEFVSCKTSDDCSWLEDPWRPAPASKVPRPYPPVTAPCKSKSRDVVCDKGVCVTRAWKC